MISLRLWQGLRRASSSKTIHWYQVYSSFRLKLEIEQGTVRSLWAARGDFLLILLAFSGVWVFIVPFLPLVLLVTGSLMGTYVAIQIAGAISFERENARYDLVSVGPTGSSGANLMIASVCLQEMDILERIKSLLLNFSFIGALGLAGFWLIGGINTVTALNGFILIAVVLSDFLQSIMIGALTGVLITTFAQERVNARTLSSLSFLMIQFCFYAFIFALCFGLIPSIFRGTDGVSLAAVNLLRLLILLMGREIILQALWCSLADRLEAPRAELDAWLHERQ